VSRLRKRQVILKGYNPDYCRNRIRELAKDYIGGDLTDPELSPLISEDPILQQQCRNRGYMTIPIGGELRNVICGGTADHEGDELKLALQCPICHTVYCKRHLAEHLDEPIYTTPRGREIRVENPEIYIGKPDADLRTEMSSWDNQELNRAFHRVDILAKSMEEGGAGSGHHGHQGVPGSRGGSAPSGRNVTFDKKNEMITLTGDEEISQTRYSFKDENGTKIGQAVVIPNLIPTDPKSVYLGWMGIDENFQGQGYGTAAYSSLEQDLAGQGYSRVYVNVMPGGSGARAFWDAQGFTPTGEGQYMERLISQTNTS